jgi:hypothetical protein
VSLGLRRRAWPQPARCLGAVFEHSGMYANNLVRISEVIRDEYLAIKLKSHFLPKGRNELLQFSRASLKFFFVKVTAYSSM